MVSVKHSRTARFTIDNLSDDEWSVIVLFIDIRELILLSQVSQRLKLISIEEKTRIHKSLNKPLIPWVSNLPKITRYRTLIDREHVIRDVAVLFIQRPHAYLKTDSQFRGEFRCRHGFPAFLICEESDCHRAVCSSKCPYEQECNCHSDHCYTHAKSRHTRDTACARCLTFSSLCDMDSCCMCSELCCSHCLSNDPYDPKCSECWSLSDLELYSSDDSDKE